MTGESNGLVGVSRFPGTRTLRRTLSFAQRIAYIYRHHRALKLFARALDDGMAVDPRLERPVIVIGMHRSGTSLLSRQLEDIGVNMGKWQGRKTNESMFFRHRNQLLLKLAHSSWDNPGGFLRAMENPDWQRAFARVADCDLGKLRTLNFLPPQSIRELVLATNPNWGFKDPRTTLTLPVWREIFPNAIIINIVRNGNAVASSLFCRGKKQLRNQMPLSLVSLDPKSGLDLWSEYVLAADRFCASLPAEQYLEIRYEELVQTPRDVLHKISNFVGLDPEPAQLEKASDRVVLVSQSIENAGRVSATARKTLEHFGYR